MNAVEIAKKTGLNRNTVNRYLNGIRKRIAEFCERRDSLNDHRTDLEKKCGYCKMQGQCGWFFEGKATIYSLISIQGKICIAHAPDIQSESFQRIVRGYEPPGTTVTHSNILRGYGCMDDIGCMKCLQGNHCKYKHDCRLSHSDDIEEFLNFAQMRLRKFRGITKSFFYFHLKECEFRYNYRSEDIFRMMLKIFRDQPIF